jgi:hypothetical protein
MQLDCPCDLMFAFCVISISFFATLNQMSDETTKRLQLRDISKLLLGSGHQAEIGAVIADLDGPVWGTSLMDTLALEEAARGMVSKELKRLRRVGLLIPASASNRFDRRALLERSDRDSAYWSLCQQLRQSAVESEDRS